MEPTLCYIRENYFKDNPSFQKVLDTGDTAKQSRRTHLCLLIESSEINSLFHYEIILVPKLENMEESGMPFHPKREKMLD